MKSYKIILLFAAAVSLNSCTDFLDRSPLDEISNSSFWNNENDIKIYNNQLYTEAADCGKTGIMMGHGNGGNITSCWFLDEMSDNLGATGTDFYANIKRGTRVVPSNPEYFDYQGWDFLHDINFGLENYNRTTVSQDIKNKYIAEAKLFRGWFYGVKVERYGDVQWIGKALNTDSPELFDKRNPREDVMDSVLLDLNFATQNLPANWGDGNAPGRLNRWCALLIKSRICLFEGTFRKYHGLGEYEKWLKEAKESAYELMTKGPYKLYQTADPVGNEDYAWIHRQNDLSGNSEVMYWRRYESGILTHNTFPYFSDYSGGATKDMVESYLCDDGLPISLSTEYKGNDGEIEDVFKNRDPRLKQSILDPEDKKRLKYYANDSFEYPRLLGMTGGRISTTGYHVIKQYNNDILNTSFNQCIQAGIILRFGEALLNYAEASAELGEISQKDLDISINLLRDRVKMPHLNMANVPVDPMAAKDGVTPLIFEIRRERRIELFCEGFRYDDLMRWKQGNKLAKTEYGILWDDKAKQRYAGANLIKSSIDPSDGKEYVDVYKGTEWENGKFDEEKDYLWPIPLNVITANPNVGQNPGWNK